MVGLVAVQRPGNMAAQRKLLQAVHHGGDRESLLEPGFEVACLVELGVQPACLESLWVVGQFVVRTARLQRGVSGLRRQHAALDCRMAALDAADIQKARIAAHQRAAGKHRLGQRQQAACGDGARAIGQALGGPEAFVLAFEIPADVGVRLPALEFLERTQVGVGVVEPGDEAQRNLVVVQVVEEGAAVGRVVHRPAGRMQHEAGLVATRVDLPQFLDAQAVGLRIPARVELEARDQLLAQMPARALGEHGVPGV